MTWQPTVGTLSDEDLQGRIEYLSAYLGEDEDATGSDYFAAVEGHIAALTKQLERARGIAVSLEQELAQRGVGRWPVRQYATVELPDEAGVE